VSENADQILASVLGELEGVSPNERVTFMQAITERFCLYCGGELEQVDCGELGKIPSVCHCEDDE